MSRNDVGSALSTIVATYAGSVCDPSFMTRNPRKMISKNRHLVDLRNSSAAENSRTF